MAHLVALRMTGMIATSRECPRRCEMIRNCHSERSEESYPGNGELEFLASLPMNLLGMQELQCGTGALACALGVSASTGEGSCEKIENCHSEDLQSRDEESYLGKGELRSLAALGMTTRGIFSHLQGACATWS